MLFSKRKRLVKRILIVEDEPLVAFDNENMVTDAGYVVVATVDEYDDVVEVLESEFEALPQGGDEDEDPRGIDLILTDISLSGDDGDPGAVRLRHSATGRRRIFARLSSEAVSGADVAGGAGRDRPQAKG